MGKKCTSEEAVKNESQYKKSKRYCENNKQKQIREKKEKQFLDRRSYKVLLILENSIYNKKTNKKIEEIIIYEGKAPDIIKYIQKLNFTTSKYKIVPDFPYNVEKDVRGGGIEIIFYMLKRDKNCYSRL